MRRIGLEVGQKLTADIPYASYCEIHLHDMATDTFKKLGYVYSIERINMEEFEIVCKFIKNNVIVSDCMIEHIVNVRIYINSNDEGMWQLIKNEMKNCNITEKWLERWCRPYV